MAAYAALVSLMTTLNNIQIHPHVSTFFDNEHIQSLHQIINVLLDFIESSNSHGGSRAVEALESRIASTAHAAEDVIESHVVDQLHAGSTHLLDLETQIEYMNSVKETIMVLRGTKKFKDEQPSSPSMSAGFSKPTTIKKDFIVGFDEKLIQIMDRLTGHQPELQVFPIVGMGGIGKTTLAKSVYDNLCIVENFDIRAWVTISQEYSVKYVLSELLSCIEDRKIRENIGLFDCVTDLETEDTQLGLKLFQNLYGRRYLIVLDDMWGLEIWDKIKFFFPKSNDDRSRVVITTRIWSVATHLSSSSFEMNFLDMGQSWELFCGNVFLQKGCPPELEKIGKKIVGLCKGLPLSIVVIGGLLRNSRSTREYWENFARDLNSILMSGNDEHCFKIISLSYSHLPAHLKPCFLYLGVFGEDQKIRVTQLVNLFVAEGFLKPRGNLTLEDVAYDYLNDLVDRNLVLVDSWRWNGRIKYCKMHDLVREVCLKIGLREKFFHKINMLDIPAKINRERCIVFYGRIPKKKELPEVSDALPAAPFARTFLLSEYGPLPFKFRLSRVLSRVESKSLEDISEHVNLRYLHWTSKSLYGHSKIPSSVFWNVHALILERQMEAPSEIWYMRQLRLLQIYKVFLPNPPPSEKVEQQDDALLPDLHTLSTVVNFNFTEEVCKRIPNIKKLRIRYTDKECQKKFYCCLDHLHKLQSLFCSFESPRMYDLLQSLIFPSSLRKLTLKGCCGLHWEDLNTFGFSLPHLQVLELYGHVILGSKWDCVEGAFPSLKFLHIGHLDLIKWIAETSDFFPVLEKLHLQFLSKLKRLPSGIGEIQTLKSLRVDWCSMSATISSTEILEEQLSLENEDLQLVLNLWSEEERIFVVKQLETKSITSKNFTIGMC